MRLTTLTLERYGIFEKQAIAFDPAPGRINLLVAANGAGKSIIRHAFCDLLFGIHAQSDMGFRFGYPGMKVTAEAIGPDREPFAFSRHKGRGQTLVAADGTSLDNTQIARLLGTTDRALLERLFALDTGRLREGAAELLASGGTLAEALIAAAGGLSHAREVRRSLEESRDALAPIRKATRRPFYDALDRLVSAGKELRTAAVKPEVREKEEKELEDFEKELVRLNEISADASRKIARLERIRRVVGSLASHDEAALWLSDHPGTPILPPDTRQKLADARSALLIATERLERETSGRQALVDAIAAIDVDTVIIERAEAIEQFNERAAVARQAAADIPRRDAELAVATGRISDLLRRLGLALPADKAADAIPPQAALLRARHLFGTYAGLTAELERLPGEIAKLGREIAETTAAIQRLAAPEDTAELSRLLREIRSEGEPGQRAQEAARAVADKEAACEAALARVPGWQHGRDALIALSPQSPDAYARLAAAVSNAKLALDKATEDIERLQAAIQDDERRLSQMAAAGPVADPAAIAAARERRDIGWRLIYRRAFTTVPPTAEDVEAWAGDVPLPLAYERSVVAADELADRRNQESERVAKAAELKHRLAEAAGKMGGLQAVRAAAEADFAGHCTAWERACEPLQFSVPPSLNEVTELIAARDQVIGAAREWKSADAVLASLTLRHAGWAGRLAAALGLPEQAPADLPPLDLPGLMQQADDHVASAANAEKERAGHQAILVDKRRALETREAEYQQALHRHQKFQTDWAVTQRELARPETEDPETTIGILDLINELDSEQKGARDLAGRLREMRDEIANFRSQARTLQAMAAPDMAAAEEFEIISELRRRLTFQQNQHQRRSTLSNQLETATAALAHQAEQHADHERVLAVLLNVIGADTVEAAEECIRAAEERLKRQEQLGRMREELHQKGDGHSIDALRTEAAELAADEIAARIDELDHQREQTGAAAQRLAAQIATRRAELDRQADATEAQTAAASQQAAIATINHVLDEAMLMHLASLLLQSSLEEIAAAGTSRLLSRIGELLSILTDGAYLRVEADDSGDGSARLIAVSKQDFPDRWKRIDELSEGERDQLFLALRLAAIEDHVTAAPPLPFLGDDILQSFDNDRALAAMRALVTLSNSVQVILLSHHPHLLSLASALPDDQVHVCRIAT